MTPADGVPHAAAVVVGSVRRATGRGWAVVRAERVGRVGRRPMAVVRGIAVVAAATTAAGGTGGADGAGERHHRLAVAEPAQVVAQLLGGRVALLGLLGQQLDDDRLERPGHVGDELVERLRRVVHLLVGDGHRVVAAERRPAGDHLVQHDAERVEVAARIGLRALGLLGREVGGRAHHRADLGEVLLGGRVHRPGDAEVGDLHLPAGADEDVGRLDVAVHDAVAVGEAERGGDVAGDLGRPARS